MSPLRATEVYWAEASVTEDQDRPLPNDEAGIREHLREVLAAPRFQRAAQLSRLLAFLVEETIAGRAGDLKEFVIGTRALGRGPAFDPEHDPIVRVQVRQLRSRLAAYYDHEGQSSPTRIEVPKGSYGAVFSARPVLTAEADTAPPRRGATRPPFGLAPRAWLITMALVVSALGSGLLWLAGRALSDGSGVSASAPVSVAVLPFANLTGQESDEYFSDGMTEELIFALSQVSGLNVIARTSAFTFKGKSIDVRQVGRDLGVDHVVEGSVRRDGARVRIGVRLTRASDAAGVWAETYERDLVEALSLQREIAARVAASLTVHATRPGAASRVDVAAAAQDLYLRGRYLWNRRTEESLSLARGLFEEALEQAPEFAQAHAALAATYAVMEFNSVTPPGESAPLARAAAERALAIDPNMPLALAVIAGLVSGIDHDWEQSGRLFEQAIALQPADATVHHWYGTNLIGLGRFDEGIRELRQAQQLDPLSMPVAYSLGEAYFFARQFDRVLEQANAMAAADPTFAGRFDLLARANAMLGRWDEALDAAERCTIAILCRAVALARAGRAAEARALAATMETSSAAALMPYSIAAVHAVLGETDAAFRWLDRAAASRQSELVVVNVDPSFDRIRSDPRFTLLVRSLNLGPVGLHANGTVR